MKRLAQDIGWMLIGAAIMFAFFAAGLSKGVEIPTAFGTLLCFKQ